MKYIGFPRPSYPLAEMLEAHISTLSNCIMKKTIIIIGVIITFIITFFAGYIYYAFSSVDEAFEPTKEVTIFQFIGLNVTLYFQVAHWGLLGNHSDIILSTENPKRKDWKFTPDRDYRFDEDYVYFKFVEPSTIIIYSNDESQKPKNFMSTVTIRLEIIQDFRDRKKIINRFKVGDVSIIGND